MRKRELQDHLDAINAELEAANAELYRLRAAQRRLEDERAALQSELDTERFVQRTMPIPAPSRAVEAASERRVVHFQATVIDERGSEDAGDGPGDSGEEAWHRSIRERLVRGCRDAENLLSVAQPSPIVRAARYALAFALRDSARMAGDAPRELQAGGVRAAGLPAGEQGSPPPADAGG